MSLAPTLARQQKTAAPRDGQLPQLTPGASGEAVLFGPNPTDFVREKGDSAEPPSIVLALVFAPDGKTLATANDDKLVYLRESATGRLKMALKGHEDAVTCVAFAPDGKRLATGGPDKTIRVWNPATGKEERILKGHTSWVYGVAFSPDGKRLASAGYDKMIRLWDVESGAGVPSRQGTLGSSAAPSLSPRTARRWLRAAAIARCVCGTWPPTRSGHF